MKRQTFYIRADLFEVRISPRAKLILAYLFRVSDRQGRSHPSVSTVVPQGVTMVVVFSLHDATSTHNANTIESIIKLRITIYFSKARNSSPIFKLR